MTKKHFKALADALAMNKAPINLCKQIAAVCADTNPRFDYRRFLIACGIDPREI